MGISFARHSTVAVMQANNSLPGRAVTHSRLGEPSCIVCFTENLQSLQLNAATTMVG